MALEFVNPVEELLWAADAFILTTRYEGLSLSVLGALVCGLRMFLTPRSRERVPGPARIRERSDGSSPRRTRRAGAEDRGRPAPLAARPASPGPAQVAGARKWFDSEVQFGKVTRLLEHVARTEGGDPA